MCLFETRQLLLLEESNLLFVDENDDDCFASTTTIAFLDQTQRGGARQWGWSSVNADPRAPTDTFSEILCRTELIIGAFRAKNCEEVDGEVRLPDTF